MSERHEHQHRRPAQPSRRSRPTAGRAGRATGRLALVAAHPRWSPPRSTRCSSPALRAVGLAGLAAGAVVAGVLAAAGCPPGHRRAGAAAAAARRLPASRAARRTAATTGAPGTRCAPPSTRWERAAGLVRRPTRTGSPSGAAPARRAGRRAAAPAARPHPGVRPGPRPRPARRPAVDVPRTTPPAAPRRRATSRRSSPNWRSCDERRGPDACPPPRSAGWPGRCWTRSARSWSASGTPLELVLAGILAGGHVLLEDLPGLGKTLTARSLRAGARAGLPPAAVHPGPAARRRHRLVPLRPAQRRLHLPGRPGLHQPAARRRDQPDPAEDPGRAAGGDAGEAGLGRGRHLPAGPAVPRARHRQPDRVRGHLPAARGAARPVPAAGLVRLPGAARRSGRCCAAGWPAARRRPTSSRWWTPRTLRAMQAALEDVVVEDSIGRYIVELTAATRRAPVGAGRRLAARLAGAAAAGPGPGGAGRPRLRGARGRQGGGGAGAGAPDHPAAGDVAAPGRPGLRGRRGARRRRPAPASGALPSYAAGRH